MGNCIRGDLRDIEVEIGIMKTDTQLRFEQLTAELLSLKQLYVQPKDRRRSYNPYMLRKHDQIKYV